MSLSNILMCLLANDTIGNLRHTGTYTCILLHVQVDVYFCDNSTAYTIYVVLTFHISSLAGV